MAPLLLEAAYGQHSKRLQSELNILEDLANMLAPSLGDRRDYGEWKRPSGILRHAAVTTELQAKLSQDKIFCLRSLIPAAEAEHLTINYNQTSAQTFAMATFASIVGSQSYDALLFARGLSEDRRATTKTSNLARLPTWAINFESNAFASGYRMMSTGKMSDEGHVGLHHGNKDCDNLYCSQPRQSCQMSRMHLKVRKLGRVLAVTTPHTRRSALEHFMNAKTTRAAGLVAEDGSTALQGHRHLLAKLGTFACRKGTSEVISRPVQLQSWHSTIDPRAAVWYHSTLYDVDRGRAIDLRDGQSDATKLLEAKNLFSGYCVASCDMKLVLFGVESGFLGIGHPGMLPGDEVAIIDESVLRIVLRRAEDVYRMVGLAFVGGFEQETLEARVGREEFPLQEITLI